MFSTQTKASKKSTPKSKKQPKKNFLEENMNVKTRKIITLNFIVQTLS